LLDDLTFQTITTLKINNNTINLNPDFLVPMGLPPSGGCIT